MARIRVKRGTRAQIEASKVASGLNVGEPYLITDENRPAFGTASNGYVECVTGSARITVSTTAPASPATGDIWIDTN